MFRQVVGTILRLAVRHADHWLPIRGSHDVPAYGFQRIIDPPPLEVNTLRLLTEFHQGSLTMEDRWRAIFEGPNVETLMVLAREAGKLADAARTRLGVTGDAAISKVTTAEMADAVSAFHFPDDLWARLVYDLITAARRDGGAIESMVASLVPVYFGRVGSFVIENRHVTTDQAEERVERQAREFELLKPYLVDRWQAGATAPAGASPAAGSQA
jgi:hypothetical protein